MIGAGFVQLLGELAVELARLSVPTVVADGSFQGAPIYGRDKLDANGYTSDELRRKLCLDEQLPRGLVPCSTCGTEQRAGAVHFAKLTDIRPCVGSWGRR